MHYYTILYRVLLNINTISDSNKKIAQTHNRQMFATFSGQNETKWTRFNIKARGVYVYVCVCVCVCVCLCSLLTP